MSSYEKIAFLSWCGSCYIRFGKTGDLVCGEEKIRLKELKTEKGLTVQQLADKAGLPKRTVEEVMRRDTCSVGTAIKLADALGVTLDELCRDKTE